MTKLAAFVAGLIAWEIVTTYCVLTAMLLYYKVPVDNVQLFSASMTALVSMATGIIGYFYGRTHEAAKQANQSRHVAPPAIQPHVTQAAAPAELVTETRSPS